MIETLISINLQLRILGSSSILQKEEIIANAGLVRQTLCDKSELEQEKASLGQELAVLVEITQNCIAENARVAQDQGEYQKRYNGLVERYEKAKARFDEVTEAIAERSAKGERLRREASPFRGRGSSGHLRRRRSLWQSSMSGSGARRWIM